MGAATVMLRDVHSGLLLAVGLDPARAELARSARGDDRAMWRESASESGCFVSALRPCRVRVRVPRPSGAARLRAPYCLHIYLIDMRYVSS